MSALFLAAAPASLPLIGKIWILQWRVDRDLMERKGLPLTSDNANCKIETFHGESRQYFSKRNHVLPRCWSLVSEETAMQFAR